MANHWQYIQVNSGEYIHIKWGINAMVVNVRTGQVEFVTIEVLRNAFNLSEIRDVTRMEFRSALADAQEMQKKYTMS